MNNAIRVSSMGNSGLWLLLARPKNFNMVNLLYRFTIYILEKLFDILTTTVYLHLALTQSRFIILKCYFARQCTGNLTVNKSGPKRRSECLQMSLQLLIHPSLLAKSKTKFQRWLGFTDPPKVFFCREPGEEYWNSQRPRECWAMELMFRVWQCPRSPSFYFPPTAYYLLFSLSLLCQISPCVISPPNKFPQAEAPPLHPFLQSQTPFILMRSYDCTYTFIETFEAKPLPDSQKWWQIYPLPTSVTASTLWCQKDCCLSVSLTLLWRWQTCFVIICISRNSSRVHLEWTQQCTKTMNTETTASSSHSTYHPEGSVEKRKEWRLESQTSLGLPSNYYMPMGLFLNLLHRVVEI